MKTTNEFSIDTSMSIGSLHDSYGFDNCTPTAYIFDARATRHQETVVDTHDVQSVSINWHHSTGDSPVGGGSYVGGVRSVIVGFALQHHEDDDCVDGIDGGDGDRRRCIQTDCGCSVYPSLGSSRSK